LIPLVRLKPEQYNIALYEQQVYKRLQGIYMKAVLAFTPCASPTYIPLGIASLSAFIKANIPQCHLNVVDLNIATWNRLIDQNTESRDFRDFMQGRLKNFYDETQYRIHLDAWKQLVDRYDHYLRLARLYLEKDSLSAELQQLLDYHRGLVMANEPELVGFSITYPRQVLISLALAKFLHSELSERIRPVIILGGAMMSALYGEEILAVCPFVDAIFEGEGESGLGMLCEKQDFSEIPGVIYRGTTSILRNRNIDTITLTKVPLPDFSELDLTCYLNPEPVIPVVFSRGCKWRKCRFCAHNFSYSGYRRHNTVRFVEYLFQLNQQIGARHFYFADQYIEAADMKILSEEILSRGLKIFFHLMGRPMNDYTDEVLQLLFRAGCRWISWGIESGSQRLLDVCRKGTSVETIRTVINDSHQAGISNLLMFIFGLPTSKEVDFNATSELINDLEDTIDDIKSSCFQLFDKTAFAAQAQNFGLKITGQEILLSNERGTIHSNRLCYKEKSADGTTRPPQGQIELAQWQRRRLWTGQHSIFQSLFCEHYLLYAAHQSEFCSARLAMSS
jgi:anaerobic magnesium-protoporphyrin IX monomethyl ester cyclase